MNAPGNDRRLPVTRVLLAAHSPILRSGLESLIGASSSFDVVENLDDPERLPEYLTAYRGDRQPDLVVFESSGSHDLSLWSPAGSDAENPIPVLALMDDLEIETLPAWLRAGARAVLPRDADPQQILAAMESVAAGLTVLHPRVLDRMLSVKHTGSAVSRQLQPLTPRELEVLDMLAQGLANKTIAWKLGISEHTVKFHIASIFDKLDVATRAEAVAAGIRNGLIMI